MKKDLGYDLLAKLLIIGDSGVGKTNVMIRFCQNNFMNSHMTTIGIDFKIKTIQVDNKKIRLQIWDTAGQQRFKTITQTYYKGSMGIVLTYSVTDWNSFQNIRNWMKQIQQHAGENVVKILVGNKCESLDRKVSYQNGKKLADQFKISFFQISAKQNININELFSQLARDIKQKIFSFQQPIQVKIPQKSNKISVRHQKNKKKCC